MLRPLFLIRKDLGSKTISLGEKGFVKKLTKPSLHIFLFQKPRLMLKVRR